MILQRDGANGQQELGASHFRVVGRIACAVALACLVVTLAPPVLTTDVSASSGQAVLYVSPSGSDRNPGTEALPFRTITRGARKLTPGAVLYVKDGVYSESLINSIPGGTSWEAPVTIAAHPGSTVVLKPPRANFVLHFQGAAQAYIVISGFIIDASNVVYDAVKITGSSSNPADAAHHIRIINSEIRNSPRNGILTTNHAHSNEFVHLKVHSNGDPAIPRGHGFYLATDGNLVYGCDVHDNANYGIHVFSANGRTHQNIIQESTVFANRSGIVLSRGVGHIARKNTVYSNRHTGIVVDYSVSGVGLYNNVIYGHGVHGIRIGSLSTNTTLSDNLVYGNNVDVVDYGS